MTKKNFYCEKLTLEDQNEFTAGDASRGGTDAGGPTSGGNAACICACGNDSDDSFWDGFQEGLIIAGRIIFGIY